jgi:hypothetical protein
MILIYPCKLLVKFEERKGKKKHYTVDVVRINQFLHSFTIWYIYKLYLVYIIRMDEGRQPLSRKIPIPSSKINPYRMIIILRLVILGLFFHYRILNPVKDAFGLWLTSVICEIWFAVSWILDQFPKWYPIERETYLDRLSLR